MAFMHSCMEKFDCDAEEKVDAKEVSNFGKFPWFLKTENL